MMENSNTASLLNLYQRMLQVSAEVMNVEKKTEVKTGKYSSYKAVADYDVVVAIKKAEAKYGIISVPVKQELIESKVLTSPGENGSQKTQFVDIVKMTMAIYNVDDPADCIEVEALGRGLDSGDKGFGKASTYARKYCLLNAYKIATGEDPDRDASVDTSYVPYQEYPATPAEAVQAPALPSLNDLVAKMKTFKDAGEAKAFYLSQAQLSGKEKTILKDAMMSLACVQRAIANN